MLSFSPSGASFRSSWMVKESVQFLTGKKLDTFSSDQENIKSKLELIGIDLTCSTSSWQKVRSFISKAAQIQRGGDWRYLYCVPGSDSGRKDGFGYALHKTKVSPRLLATAEGNAMLNFNRKSSGYVESISPLFVGVIFKSALGSPGFWKKKITSSSKEVVKTFFGNALLKL